MRTVSDAPVSGVTSLRLLRQHLWRRTGSLLPFRIRAASPWHFIFRACILAPRGGPRSEPPQPSGCQPTISSSYIRGSASFFLLSSHSQLPRALRALSPPAPSLPPFVARAPPPGEPPLQLRRASPSHAAQRFTAVRLLPPHRTLSCDLYSSS